MTELFGRLTPDASVESARAELTAVHAAIEARASRVVLDEGDIQLTITPLRDQITSPARTSPARAAGRGRHRVHHCVLERRQPDPGALGPPRRRAGRARRAGREPGGAAADAAGRKSRAVRRRRRARACCSRGRSSPSSRGLPRASRCARSRSPSIPACSGCGAGLAMAAAMLLAPSRLGQPEASRSTPDAGAARIRVRRTAACASLRARADGCACSRRPRLRSRSSCSPAPARWLPR